MLPRGRKRKSSGDAQNVSRSKMKIRINTGKSVQDKKSMPVDEDLAKFLFGNSTSFLQSLEQANKEPKSLGTNSDSGVGDESDVELTEEFEPVWVDEDDGIDVGEALKKQGRRLPHGGHNDPANKYKEHLEDKFQKILSNKPAWATIRKTPNQSSELCFSGTEERQNILSKCNVFVNKQGFGSSLPASNTIKSPRMRDLNSTTYNEGKFINCVEFHRSSSVAMVAGNGCVASFFIVDGKTNSKLHSVAIENFPIFCGAFVNNEAIFGSRVGHIYSYDLNAIKPIRIQFRAGITSTKKFIISPDQKMLAFAGRYGECHLVSATTKERTCILKQNYQVTALAYHPNGNLLFGHSNEGSMVTVWDTRMNRVCHKFLDDGCLNATTMAVSANNQFFATGSQQGVVNLYDTQNVLKDTAPKVRKSIFNLTTSIGDLKFNPSSEILAISSPDIPNCVRLMNLGTCNIFNNFPQLQDKIGHANVLNFSPNSGYMAIGNCSKVACLYRLHNFENY